MKGSWTCLLGCGAMAASGALAGPNWGVTVEEHVTFAAEIFGGSAPEELELNLDPGTKVILTMDLHDGKDVVSPNMNVTYTLVGAEFGDRLNGKEG